MASLVVITLIPIRYSDDFSSRILTLTPEKKRWRLGRSSKRQNLIAAQNNAWLDNPVISRCHAELWISQYGSRLYIDDLGSTHGTFVNGRKLHAHESESLSDGDKIRLGESITRGKDSFPPREFLVKLDWKVWNPLTPESSSPPPETSSPNLNTPKANDAIDINSENVRPSDQSRSSIASDSPPRCFKVPDSDSSSESDDAEDKREIEMSATVDVQEASPGFSTSQAQPASSNSSHKEQKSEDVPKYAYVEDVVDGHADDISSDEGPDALPIINEPSDAVNHSRVLEAAPYARNKLPTAENEDPTDVPAFDEGPKFQIDDRQNEDATTSVGNRGVEVPIPTNTVDDGSAARDSLSHESRAPYPFSDTSFYDYLQESNPSFGNKNFPGNANESDGTSLVIEDSQAQYDKDAVNLVQPMPELRSILNDEQSSFDAPKLSNRSPALFTDTGLESLDVVADEPGDCKSQWKSEYFEARATNKKTLEAKSQGFSSSNASPLGSFFGNAMNSLGKTEDQDKESFDQSVPRQQGKDNRAPQTAATKLDEKELRSFDQALPGHQDQIHDDKPYSSTTGLVHTKSSPKESPFFAPKDERQPKSTNPFARISITDIVDTTSDGESANPLKRKINALLSSDLDDNVPISEDESSIFSPSSQDVLSHSADFQDAQPREVLVSSSQSSVVEAHTIAQETPAVLPSADTGTSEEPAKKKRRVTNPGNQSLARYAATALAGAIVGGIGVFAALLSLPESV
ncbi:MAG: hypothetical protein M1819_003594 [Sarea resinae]|nr:MAG: hypothetical protein M1819_003594 [Sarea resinae]